MAENFNMDKVKLSMEKMKGKKVYLEYYFTTETADQIERRVDKEVEAETYVDNKMYWGDVDTTRTIQSVAGEVINSINSFIKQNKLQLKKLKIIDDCNALRISNKAKYLLANKEYFVF